VRGRSGGAEGSFEAWGGSPNRTRASRAMISGRVGRLS